MALLNKLKSAVKSAGKSAAKAGAIGAAVKALNKPNVAKAIPGKFAKSIGGVAQKAKSLPKDLLGKIKQSMPKKKLLPKKVVPFYPKKKMQTSDGYMKK